MSRNYKLKLCLASYAHQVFIKCAQIVMLYFRFLRSFAMIHIRFRREGKGNRKTNFYYRINNQGNLKVFIILNFHNN